jgi:hypothetical protein
MSIVFRFTGILVIGLAAIAAAMSIGGHKAQAAGATIECTIPLAVECDVYHPDGVANVTVTVDFGPELGLIDVVDEDFNCQRNVSVSWDPIVPNGDIKVTPCQGFDFKDPGRDDDRVLRGSLIILAHSDPRLEPMQSLQKPGYGGPDTIVVYGGPDS